MRILRSRDLSPAEYREALRRPERITSAEETVVRGICEDVRRTGDEAVRRSTARFDRVHVDVLRLPEAALADARRRLEPALREALETAAGNIRRFHDAQRFPSIMVETMPGVRCWRESRPISTVGLYIPAGSAPLPSTVLMLGIPALLAGCSRVVLCSPPRAGGSVDPVVLATADLIGLSEIYAIGGVQAIAAMAYGTESVPRVDKVFGPGNRFVAAAKRQVAADPDGTAVDLIAGPSEVIVLADETATAESVAWDLVSQAEHDADAHALLVTTHPPLAEMVTRRVEEILVTAPRGEQLRTSLGHSIALLVETMDEGIAFANAYAPEHLVLTCRDAESVAARILNAGSVFIGAYAPVTAGDYASGTNHTLPTGGAARATGGISLQSFEKQVTFQSLTREGLALLAPALDALAAAEGLEAHRRAVTVRLAERDGNRP